jgi:hypothetical protein
VKIGRTKRTAAKNRDNRLSFAADNLSPSITTRHEGDIVLGTVSQ